MCLAHWWTADKLLRVGKGHGLLQGKLFISPNCWARRAGARRVVEWGWGNGCRKYRGDTTPSSCAPSVRRKPAESGLFFFLTSYRVKSDLVSCIFTSAKAECHTSERHPLPPFPPSPQFLAVPNLLRFDSTLRRVSGHCCHRLLCFSRPSLGKQFLRSVTSNLEVV